MLFRRFSATVAVLLIFVCCALTASALTTGLTYVPPESSATPEGARPAQRSDLLLPELLIPTVRAQLTIDSTGLHLIEGFEGYDRCAYWDPYGRVLTAGFGQTKGIFAGFCFASRTAAEANLKLSVQVEYEWAVHQIGYPFNQHEVDALDSFAYNLGAGIFTGPLRSDLAGGRIYAASRIMLTYDHAGGIVLPGLKTRRELEVRLLLMPVKAPTPSRNQLRRQLEHDYVYRSRLRRDLVRQHCRVAKPSAHCRGLLKSGTQVNRQIRALHARHIY